MAGCHFGPLWFWPETEAAGEEERLGSVGLLVQGEEDGVAGSREAETPSLGCCRVVCGRCWLGAGERRRMDMGP